MPVTDKNASRIGQSKASNVSAASRDPPKPLPPTTMVKTDMLTSAPGVMSMLKSSTELGTDSLVMPGPRFSAQMRNSNRQSGITSRLSTGSSRSQHSRPASGQKSHYAWPSISSGGRRLSMTSNYSNIAAAQHYLDTMPPASLGNMSDPASLPPPQLRFRDSGGRSLSLTNSVHRHGGLANYRSLSSLRGHEPLSRPRSPYRHLSRPIRPGHRPASPAVSDITGGMVSRAYQSHNRPGSGLRKAHGAHGSQGSFHSYGSILPPPIPPRQKYHGPRDRSSPTVTSPGSLEYVPGMYPPSLPASRQGTPSASDHPALLMTPTNRTVAQSTPQSSDPPSSTPPTPANPPAAYIMEPTIAPNIRSSSRCASTASATMPTYYDYSEQFETTIKDAAYTSTLTTPPSMGFVQRIQTLLEEQRGPEPPVVEDIAVAIDAMSPMSPGQSQEVHELPASPVVNRITRELIRATLQPTSESSDLATPTPSTLITSTPQTLDCKHGEPQAAANVLEFRAAAQSYKRGQSKGSRNASMCSDSTMATAAMDYALRYTPPPEQTDDGNTMSDFLNNYGSDDRHMTTVIEEPTEPVTIATAEVEVSSPTPTQPRWKPSYDTPPDMLRTQSAVVSSSIYSSDGEQVGSMRYSAPLLSSLQPALPSLSVSQSPRRSVFGVAVPKETDPKSVHRSDAQPVTGAQNSVRISKESQHTLISRQEAVMPSPRPPSAIEKLQRLEGNAPLSEHSSAAGVISEQNQTTQPVRPSTAVERVSDRVRAVLPPRTLSSVQQQLASTQDAKVAQAAPSKQNEPLQEVYRAASPVSPLSDVNMATLDTITASPVSPLLCPELVVNKRESNVSSIWSYRKPLPKRPDSPASTSTRASVRDPDALHNSGMDRESVTDLRFSSLGFRPVTRQLDDVKEEPRLETSTVDLRASMFKFPLPQRKSSLAHYEEFRTRESKRKASIDQIKVCATRDAAADPQTSEEKKVSPLRVPLGAVALSELRAIPSLHFSRVDLFSKLNEALDLQPKSSSSNSLKDADDAQSELENTGVMRMKYRSFFESLDHMANDPTPLTQPLSEGKGPVKPPTKSPRVRKHVKLPKIQQWPPEELIAEIDRLSIPSIDGLAQRLSELMPSLRRYYGGEHSKGTEEDENVRSALDEIRRLGAELIPGFGETDPSNEGDSSELYETTSASSSSAHDNTSPRAKPKIRPRSASSPSDRPVTTPLAELDGAPTVSRSRSMSHWGCSGSKLDGDAGTNQSQPARRSTLSSPPESRPWNVDTSYPWTNSVSAIDISLPAPNFRRDHIKPRPSRLRLHDDALEAAATATDLTSDSAVSDIAATPTAERSYSRTIKRHRRTSKRSFLGSISCSIGIQRGTSIDNSGYATGPDILRGVDDRTVDPGDRYPTTGLSPPSALNIEEVGSFFSDDSSHFEVQSTSRSGGLRKRLSNLKTKLPPMSRTHSVLDRRPNIASGPSLRRSNSVFFARGNPKPTHIGEWERDVPQLDEAAGMPKTEVRAKKLVNRMKTLWHRRGALLRSLSGKRRTMESPDWDDEDGESIIWPNI